MINLKLVITIIFVSCSMYAQKFNQFNDQGQRHGKWKKNYANGNLRYTGEFVNGKEFGLFKFYENSGYITKPISTKEYSSSTNEINVKYFFRNGNIKAEGKVIGRNRVGEWKFYFASGKEKLMSVENYNNGKLNGLCRDYYSNGKLTSEVNYLNGVKHGLSKIYSVSGILIEKLNYNKGTYDGICEIYDTKGNLTEKGSYVNGKRSEDWIFYSPDGTSTTERKKKKISISEINKLYQN